MRQLPGSGSDLPAGLPLRLILFTRALIAGVDTGCCIGHPLSVDISAVDDHDPVVRYNPVKPILPVTGELILRLVLSAHHYRGLASEARH